MGGLEDCLPRDALDPCPLDLVTSMAAIDFVGSLFQRFDSGLQSVARSARITEFGLDGPAYLFKLLCKQSDRFKVKHSSGL